MKAKGERAAFEHEAEWPEDAKPVPISLRDVRRLPLDRIATAAVTAVRQLMAEPSPDRMAPLAEALSLQGRPTGGNKVKFYAAIADHHRMYTKAGRSPAKEIARRKRVSENLAHQWIFQARRLGFLEQSPRSHLSKREDS